MAESISNMRKSSSNISFGFKDVANFILEWFFAPVYALTVTPFTVQFFQRFVNPPNTDIQLFGFFLLGKVHEFFLPIFVLILEIISVQVATGWWRSVLQYKLGMVFALSIVFVLLQSFPTFSTYYDARIYELNQIQNAEIERQNAEIARAAEQDRAAEQRRNEQNEVLQNRYKADLDEYNRQLGILQNRYKADLDEYNRQLGILQNRYKADLDEYNRQLEEYNKRKETLEQQITQKQADINTAKIHVDQLLVRINNPVTLAERRQLEAELVQSRQLIEDYRNAKLSAEDALQQLLRNPLSPPTQPESIPPPTQPESIPPPTQPNLIPPPTPIPVEPTIIVNKGTDVEFVIETANQPKALLAIFVSFIFPCIVFGAGYVIALNNMGENRHHRLPLPDISYELMECSKLPPNTQSSYASMLNALISANIAQLRASKVLILTNSQLHADNEFELQIVDEIKLLQNQVMNSRVSSKVKETMNEHIERIANAPHIST